RSGMPARTPRRPTVENGTPYKNPASAKRSPPALVRKRHRRRPHRRTHSSLVQPLARAAIADELRRDREKVVEQLVGLPILAAPMALAQLLKVLAVLGSHLLRLVHQLLVADRIGAQALVVVGQLLALDLAGVAGHLRCGVVDLTEHLRRDRIPTP